jgi:hypothetical protein
VLLRECRQAPCQRLQRSNHGLCTRVPRLIAVHNLESMFHVQRSDAFGTLCYYLANQRSIRYHALSLARTRLFWAKRDCSHLVAWKSLSAMTRRATTSCRSSSNSILRSGTRILERNDQDCGCKTIMYN